MTALLFIVGFALLLGALQFLGWTRDSRDPNNWRAPESAPAESTGHRSAHRLAA